MEFQDEPLPLKTKHCMKLIYHFKIIVVKITGCFWCLPFYTNDYQ